MATLCIEGFGGFVASTAAPIATGWSDQVAGRDLHPLKIRAFSRRTRKYTLLPRQVRFALRPRALAAVPGNSQPSQCEPYLPG
jgi:hypothetical protein